MNRVVVVTAEFPYGLAEGFLADELNAFSPQVDLRVAPVRWWRKPKRRVLRDDVRVLELGGPSALNAALTFLFCLSRPRRTLRAMATLARDIRHLPKNLLVIPFATALSRHCEDQEIGHVHAHWLSTSATAALLVHIWTDITFSVTAHRWDIFDRNLHSVKSRNAKFIRFISRSGREAFASQLGLVSIPTPVIHLGVEQPVVLGLPKDSLEAVMDRPLRVVTPGNLIPVKGHSLLVDAIYRLGAEATDIEVDIFGDGPLREDLLRMIDKLGLTSVIRLRGAVPRADLLRRYAEGYYDLVVMPSLDLGQGLHEGIPVSLMEAMSYSIPAVSSRTGGIPELIEHDVEGWLIENGSIAELEGALKEAATQPSLLIARGEAAKRKIENEFTSSMSANSLAALMFGG